jgi:hypothetical protein
MNPHNHDRTMNVHPQPGAESGEPSAHASQLCERCGAAFRCGALAGDAACWCASLPALPLGKLRPGARCLCRACLTAQIAKDAAQSR